MDQVTLQASEGVLAETSPNEALIHLQNTTSLPKDNSPPPEPPHVCDSTLTQGLAPGKSNPAELSYKAIEYAQLYFQAVKSEDEVKYQHLLAENERLKQENEDLKSSNHRALVDSQNLQKDHIFLREQNTEFFGYDCKTREG